ncbi:MFS transporter [Arsenicicoccus dermatophilus]|uniref:MFS transporter n=1 Tax=Arsenicicoccus dermatophilus TaxID=1076331 RepID=UPI003916E65E
MPFQNTTRPALVLATMALTQFMVILDDTVVNVALPSLGRELRFTPGGLAWVVDAYMLAFGGCMLLCGRLADLVGRRAVFLAGVAVFTLASLCSGLAQNDSALVAARAAQGLGAAALTPSALAIVLHTFTEPAARRQVMGLWSGLQGVSGVLGVLVGGIVTDRVGWRWVFLVNVPVGILMVLGVLAARLPAQPRHPLRTLDVPGALTATLGLALLTWAVLGTVHRSWTDPVTLLGLSGAVVLLGAFVVLERRAPQPLLDLGIFARRDFSVAALATALLSAALFALFFFLTQYLQVVQGLTPWQTGLHWIPWSITLVLVAGASTQLLPRLGARVMVVAGGLLGAGGFLLCTRLQAGGSYATQQLPALLCLGVGVGLAMLPLAVVLTRRVAATAAGEVSAVMGTLQQVGGALGVASLASIAVARGQVVLARAPHDPAGAVVEGFHRGFLVAAGLMAAVALLGLLLPSLRGEVTAEDAMAV